MDLDHRFCLAPMMDWSDRHCRYFWRQLTQKSLLYTEMVTTGALLHADPARFLQHHEEEHPLALQLGGSDADELAKCAVLAQEWGYDEVNLNCGCPSDRVQNGRFGACLMAEPDTVAKGVAAMIAACDIPVTVKHRIGIDELDSYDHMLNFVDTVANAGVSVFIVHARKAWLSGLSPKENREVPPLQYDAVYRLKQERPELTVVINGGISDIDSATAQLQEVDGVMMGRAAYQNPWLLHAVDHRIFNAPNPATLSRHEVITNLIPYIEAQLAQGSRLNHITRHVLGLYNGEAGARKFRRFLSENAHKPDATSQTLMDALNQMDARDAELA